MDTEKIKKYTFIILTLFLIFVIGAIIFYFAIIRIFPDIVRERVDADGHHGELVIPNNTFRDMEELEGSIEDLVKTGQTGEEVKLQNSKVIQKQAEEQAEEQNQFIEEIKLLEKRSKTAPQLISEEELIPTPFDLIEQTADEIEGPDNVFEFNPL